MYTHIHTHIYTYTLSDADRWYELGPLIHQATSSIRNAKVVPVRCDVAPLAGKKKKEKKRKKKKCWSLTCQGFAVRCVAVRCGAVRCVTLCMYVRVLCMYVCICVYMCVHVFVPV